MSYSVRAAVISACYFSRKFYRGILLYTVDYKMCEKKKCNPNSLLLIYKHFITNMLMKSFYKNFSSVQFRYTVMSNSLQPHELQHTWPLPVHHQLLEFNQTYIHWVSDAIQPSHPLSSPSLLAANLSQHQSLFQWIISSHQVTKVLEFQLQHHSFQRTPRTALP